jgi:hypothetical protein
MDDSLNPFAQQSAHEVIVAKRDRILAERAKLLDIRSELLAKIRKADRELADCRAAARLFDLDIAFPEEDERAAYSRRELEFAHEREERARNAARHGVTPGAIAYRVARSDPSQPPPQLVQSVPEPPTRQARPSLRAFVLDQVQSALPGGRKAAEMRELFERIYGDAIHEKTVGMTLYRLSKEGLVHRDGHNWYFGPAAAEGPIAEGDSG